MPEQLDNTVKYALSTLLQETRLPSGIVQAWWESETTIIATVTDDFAGDASTTLTITITQDGP